MANRGVPEQKTCRRAEQFGQGMQEAYSQRRLRSGGNDTGGTPRTDPAPPSGYTITWTVTDDEPITGAKEIVLTADWTGRFGQRTVRLVGVKHNF